MGLGGGGGGGTTTQVVNNVPFNAQELKTVQDNAIGLLNSDPFQYYPGQTYAGPSDQQNFGYPRVGNLGINSGDITANNIGYYQNQALNTNQSFAQGENAKAASPFISQLSGLGNNLSSSPAFDSLGGIMSGNFFNNNLLPLTNQLSNIGNSYGGSLLTNIAQGGQFAGAGNVLNQLQTNPAGAAGGPLNGIANGAYVNGELGSYGTPLAQSGYTGPGAWGLNNAGAGYLLNNVTLPAAAQLDSVANGPAASALLGYGAGGATNATLPSTFGLYGVAGGQDVNSLSNFGAGAGLGLTSPYARGLTQLASNGAATDVLSGEAAGGASRAVDPYAFNLAGVAGGPAVGSLNQTASGAYLNSNPYLDATFKAASDPLVNAFQTAIAPTVDSRMAAAGRFNSGATANAQSVAQQNLGQSLANLSAGIYEPAYENERNRQIQAATNSANASTNALQAAGGLVNAATGQQINAAGTLGGLQSNLLSNAGGLVQQGVNSTINAATNAAGAQTNALTNAGQLANQGVSNAINANTNAGNLQSNVFSNAGNLANQGANTFVNAATNAGQLYQNGLLSAGNLYNTASNTAAQTALGLGNLNLNSLTSAGNIYDALAGIQGNAASNLTNATQSGLSGAANNINQGVNAMLLAGQGYGGLQAQDVNAQNNALTSALGSIYNFGNQQESAAQATPNLTQMPFSDYQAAISAGSAQQQLQQQALQDQQNRFYGTQQAPYNNLASVAGIIGGAIPGSAATTSPFFTNPLGQIAGGIGAANSLFGNNGLLNGAFGGSGIGALGTGAINSELASGLGLSGASAIPFTDFAGSGALSDALTSSIAATAPVAADAGASAASFLPFLAK